MSLADIRKLQEQLRLLDREVRQSKAPQVGVVGVKTSARSAVDEYYRSVRSAIIQVASAAELSGLDRAMRDLLECSQRYSTKTRYREIIHLCVTGLGAAERILLERGSGQTQASVVDAVDSRIVDTLAGLVPSAALSYKQASIDLVAEKRLSWRGPATDLREALRETLDHLAPDEEVMAQSGFKVEKDCTGPTMKQKVRFVLSKRGLSKTVIEAPENAASAIETAVGTFVRSVYSRSNLSTHTPTNKDEVLRVRDWVRVALCELLEIR